MEKPRLREHYEEHVRGKLAEIFGFGNPHQIPRLEKIVVNVGMGRSLENNKLPAQVKETVLSTLSIVSGQKPILIKARKSVSNFKVREGQPIGASVTLRGYRMWEFFDRLVSVALPRVRDFRGPSPKAFAGRGNYTLGIREQIIFPEVDYDKVERITGLNVTMVTTARNDAEGKALFTYLGVPFRS